MRAHPATCALLVIALTCVRADVRHNHKGQHSVEHNARRDHNDGCLYSGRWFTEGATVSVRDTCLRCRCVRGALSCARAACAPAPDPPPKRCALLHRRGACCPELHCPDGVKPLELSAEEHSEEKPHPSSTEEPGHACVEEGGVFAAGSALSGRAACEHCFCLRGARRCVRPRCLPPPPGCAPRPAPPSCCPQRYYCHTHADVSTESPRTLHVHDCQVNGEWVQEGERVPNPDGAADNCTQCFCLRGGVRCQQLACAPALRGCRPLLRTGHCCPHQYHCPNHAGTNSILMITDNALLPLKADERSLRTSTSPKVTTKLFPGAATSTRDRSGNPLQTTAKVKRKIEESQPLSTVSTAVTESVPLTTTAQSPHSTSTEQFIETTLQPDNSIKIIINGTINCTAELSSDIGSSIESNFTVKEADNSQPSMHQHDEAVESASDAATEESLVPTTSVVDIITRRADYDEQDSFTVNVSSSLLANTSRPVPLASPSPPSPTPTPADVTVSPNISKEAKEDYDYDYTEPTLPPSLPNLKIIPFVAADAVVDEEEAKHESAPFSALEREDKFPVYYPSEERMEPPFADRRLDSLDAVYPALLVTRATKPATTPPATTTTRRISLTTPEVNLFSPPIETEGGFIPKGPGIIDEYYAVYPNSPPPVPHLTTSMPINPNTPETECITEEGVTVLEGESVLMGCKVCSCAWGELSCAPMRCPTPPGCTRRSNLTRCCGQLVCDNDTRSSSKQPTTLQNFNISPTTPQAPFELDAGLVPFDPPADRSVPTPETIPTSTTEPQLSTQPYTNITINVSLNKTDETSEITTSVSSLTSETFSSSTPSPTHLNSSSALTITAPTMTVPTLTNALLNQDNENTTDHHSQEYDEEEEDEGFSFGSVLKLLLSDSLETATPGANKSKKPTTVVFQSSSTSTTTKRVQVTSSRATSPRTPFLSPSLPPSYPYTPPKKTFMPNTVNRIDHLVLGEATAIRKSTPRPATTPFRPLPTSSLKRFTMHTSTRRPQPAPSTTSPPPLAFPPHASLMPGGGGGGGGLFKLAGCNIYGQMYRVGRIIAELSTPCQECRCTEVGVQCAPLHC